jgi:hypothetical protein
MKDLEKPTESSEQIAERKWRNNALSKKLKEGKVPIPVMVDPQDIDYVNKKVKVDKNPPPDVATVLVNKAKRRPGGFERKFLKEVRAILDERKQENLRLIRASIRHQKRRLMLEKIRRLELSIAESEKRIALRQKHADEVQIDLFGPRTKYKDLFA